MQVARKMTHEPLGIFSLPAIRRNPAFNRF
ncbi:MAG: hypothetical protein ACI831_001785 [Candidatus Azotimanducaceae bacterium]